MGSIAKNYLKEFIDSGESNYRAAVRQANIDGNADYPSPDSSGEKRSKWEMDFSAERKMLGKCTRVKLRLRGSELFLNILP